MGVQTELKIVTQAKKGQGETNERLDAILAELQKLTALLSQNPVVVGKTDRGT